MKVLGIIGSPRKGGNTDILVSEVLKGAVSKGAQQEKIYLDDFQMFPCKTCGKCKTTGICIQPDDFNLILEKIKEASAIVLGSPVYCKTVTAQTKILIDKIDSSQIIVSSTSDGKTKFSRRIRTNKKGVIICIGDLSGLNTVKQSAGVMRCLFRDLSIEVIDEILANKLSEKGDALKNKPILQQAFIAGTKLR
ncbi:flavodoxin family protein [candidate division WOR-3 bacterium]|nr:flavodoxin family protein [candidate division WOR-3 bacterium]